MMIGDGNWMTIIAGTVFWFTLIMPCIVLHSTASIGFLKLVLHNFDQICSMFYVF